MSDDELSTIDSPAEMADISAYDKQKTILESYLKALPYKCESIDEMHSKLEGIVEKIFVAARSKNWLVLSSYDGVLQCWLLMRYPIQKSTRAKLIRLYYELCLLPGIESRVLRNWADMVSRLLANKPGLKRRLELSDLELPWKPLWRALQKEIWPKSSLEDPSRNLVNIFLYVAEQCKRYFPPEEIPSMLDVFLPLVTKESYFPMVHVLTSFLPTTNTHLYLPTLFKFWEAVNSAGVDERMLGVCADLSEEHVAGPMGEAGETGGANFKDVGVWSQEEWEFIISKGLGSLHVPVGAMKGASSTSHHADLVGKNPLKIKRPVSRTHAIAKIFVYSFRVDGEERLPLANPKGKAPPKQTGYVAGSKALDTLDRFMTSIESFFHPSQTSHYSFAITTLLHRLASEFEKRWREEELPTCLTPVTHRLTKNIRRSFVEILRTPVLLAMFSKDPLAMGLAHGALKTLALMEPTLMMPELLERAYSGLEVVNETHRTTAVLSMLSGIARPLAREQIWLGGQKHILPLLELCIPGIDLNDPAKTVCATVFILTAVQHIKIGDLSQAGSAFTEIAGDDVMETDDVTHLPDGSEESMPTLSREDERSLLCDSTAGFADWLVSLFRRVFSLFEYLPEEGGKKNTTGGKQEESVLKAITGMVDVVTLHLSDPLFDLVLNLVYDYATTNAKSNSVRAFGQLVACLARVQPEKTLAKFVPYCSAQIEEELKHGASSVRTTSTHLALPSDTTLHWNMSILRGCMGNGGKALVPHKRTIIKLLKLLVEKTKSERGYTSNGRLLTRIVSSLGSIYPYNTRFANPDEWNDPAFEKSHNLHWGKFYEPQDVTVEWHVPTEEEIAFIIDVIDEIGEPTLNMVERLLKSDGKWDTVTRNDFCRCLHACRAIWLGLPMFIKEQPKHVSNPCVNTAYEQPELVLSHLDVEAGFVLSDPNDPRYQKVLKRRQRFVGVVLSAAKKFTSSTAAEDHIDAVITVTRAIDTCLNVYGCTRSEYDSLQKNYTQARELNRYWVRQKDNARLVFIKRAHVYHVGRAYMHSIYRRRSEMDDKLIRELVELSLSTYTRIRRQAQSVLFTVTTTYIRSTRFILPMLFKALEKGNDPDRMKGALYVLGSKGIASYAIGDAGSHRQYLTSLLECQHEEKPSIQKLVNSLSQECLTFLAEEAVHTDAYILDSQGVEKALDDLAGEFSEGFVDQALLQRAMQAIPVRARNREEVYRQTVVSILEIASRPTVHWRYIQIAARFLGGLLRRDSLPPPQVAKFLISQVTTPQPSVRNAAMGALNKLLAFVKIRTYATSAEEAWREEWKNPLAQEVPVGDPNEFLQSLWNDPTTKGCYIDQVRTGFLTWTKNVKGYKSTEEEGIAWHPATAGITQAVREVVRSPEFMTTLINLWGQDTAKADGSSKDLEARSDNLRFIKLLTKVLGDDGMEHILDVIDPLLFESDKYKQRAAAEILAGIMRGSKHWPASARGKLWQWLVPRFDRILGQMKPETLPFWETIFQYILLRRDPRRLKPLIDWILSLPLEFEGDSAFEMCKPLSLMVLTVDAIGVYFSPHSERYITALFNGCKSSYAEMRQQICQGLYLIMANQWEPWYPTTEALLAACEKEADPFHLRDAPYMRHVQSIVQQLPKWREERLPPPYVGQSTYDKVGFTMLLWIWITAHGPQACLMFPYVIEMMPEILNMSELHDNSELQTYSSAVLYIISAVTPTKDHMEAVLNNFVQVTKSATSWRIRLNALPPMVVFFYRNLLSISQAKAGQVMDVLLECLADENVEVRESASKMFSGVVRCSQRQSIIPLKDRFVELARKTPLPPRRDPGYGEAMRKLHSAILGLCALIETLPYSVEPWMPPLTEVLAPHATDPPPISTTIRKCASEFKKTHQDTWHHDQLLFDEDQLQSLSTMLVGTSYYA